MNWPDSMRQLLPSSISQNDLLHDIFIRNVAVLSSACLGIGSAVEAFASLGAFIDLVVIKNAIVAADCNPQPTQKTVLQLAEERLKTFPNSIDENIEPIRDPADT
mmetsp:Transcript_22687/g.31129  ORF Transcript_22687/g.31129 Transcript_22687/m.31129 type:complete len:105 (+) Transcript_22687:106-420(+)